MKAAFFVSRNKDNKDVPGFKERKRVFLYDEATDNWHSRFDRFVKEGLPGEFCRFYVSVNERDMEAVRKELICRLVKDEGINLKRIESTIVSIAMKKENAANDAWLFDFDEDDYERLLQFRDEVAKYTMFVPRVYKTPNGFAIISEVGFDTRELLEHWPNVELKRDGMLCMYWRKKQ